MKPIRSLILIAIGMIAFTATAHTVKPEQKQKTELSLGLYPDLTFVCVNDFQVVPVFTEPTIFSSSTALSFKSGPEPIAFYAIVTDVGWSVSKQRFRQIHYKEKLRQDYNLHFKDKLLFSAYSVRDNC